MPLTSTQRERERGSRWSTNIHPPAPPHPIIISLKQVVFNNAMEEKGKKELDRMMTADQKISTVESELTSAEKSELLTEDHIKSSTSSGAELEEKIQHREAKTKEEVDVTSDTNDESPTLPNSSQLQAKAKGSIDPVTTEKISSISDSKLNSSEKSSLSASNLNEEDTSPSKVNTCGGTLSGVQVEGKYQHIDKEEAKGDHHNFFNDGASEKNNNDLSSSRSPQQEAKENVALEFKRTEGDKLAYNRTEEDIPPSEDGTYSTLSKVELEEKDRHMQMGAKGEHVYSSFHSRVTPVKDDLLNMKGQEIFIVRDQASGNNAGEKTDEKIHKMELICKHCSRFMFNETYGFKAKCGCKFSLIHKDCALIWKEKKGQNCQVCEQEIENIDVILVPQSSSSPSQTSGEGHEEKSSTSTRSSSCTLM